MRHARFWMLSTLALPLLGCSDGQPAITASSAGPSFDSYYDCLVGEIHLSYPSSTILQGTNQEYHAIAIGKRRGDSQSCSLAGADVTFNWSVSPTNLAQVGQIYTSDPDSWANIYGAAPGNITVTVTAQSQGFVTAPTITKTATATVVAPTPTPSVGPITGPQTPSASGTYNYTVTASGGNGTYSYTWETRHGGGGWTVAHTATGGSPNTAPIPIVGGRLYEVRVKVTSGTSSVATSAVLTVDATAATPPLGVSLIGSDNIRERGVHEWEAVASGGAGNYTYSWRMERPGATDVTGYTGSFFSWWFDSCDEEPDGSFLEVTVSSGGQTATATLSLNVETYLRSPCD